MIESGHYSIAGFVYQLIGSGVEAFEICTKIEDEACPVELLVLERFGQDAVALPAGESGRPPRLIQYKFSNDPDENQIEQNELRKILEAFLRSTRSENKASGDFTYELITNRPYADTSKKWVAAQKEGQQSLSEQIKTSAKADIPDLEELREIYDKLTYKQQSVDEFREILNNAAKRLGVLESELKLGIDSLAGYLVRKSGESGSRVVWPADIRHRLAGHTNACELFSNESVRIRRKSLSSFQERAAPMPLIPRNRVGEILDAVLQYPLVVVHGDGGSGKSVAMSDVVANCLNEDSSPPGFSMVMRMFGCDSQAAMNQIAGWRNLDTHKDSQQLEKSFRRLQRAFPNCPTLLVCIDAIDERQTDAIAPETEEFIYSLVEIGKESRRQSGIPSVTVLLTCRRFEELESLSSWQNEIAPKDMVKSIEISGFADDELIEAAREFESVGDIVSQRIMDHFETAGPSGRRRLGTALQTVSTDTIDIIRHPVLWSIFARLTDEAQHHVLDGSDEGIQLLGEQYLKWFRKKAGTRIKDLRHEECACALAAAATRFREKLGQAGQVKDDWIDPVSAATGEGTVRSKQLYIEALTAGIIEDDEIVNSQKWRWRHDWFCKYLISIAEA